MYRFQQAEPLRRSRPMIRLARFVIAVPDLEISARFYQDVLGFEIHETGDPGWRFFVRDACEIMAGQCPDALSPSKLGDHSYFAYLVVEDVQEYFDRVVDAGAEVTKPLADEPWGMREFGIRTIDGHRIMLGQELQD